MEKALKKTGLKAKRLLLVTPPATTQITGCHTGPVGQLAATHTLFYFQLEVMKANIEHVFDDACTQSMAKTT